MLHTIDDAGVPQVTEYVHYRGMTPDKMAAETFTLCNRWQCFVVGVESVALQKTLLYYFSLVFRLQGFDGVEFVPIEVGRQYKMGRLITFASAIVTGEYTLAEGDWGLSGQMMQIDKTKTNNLDDLTDAASMGMIMLRRYRGLIEEKRAATIAMPPPKAIGSSTNI